MAEENAAQSAPESSGGGKGQKPTLFIILAIFNMLVVGGVAARSVNGHPSEAVGMGPFSGRWSPGRAP